MKSEISFISGHSVISVLFGKCVSYSNEDLMCTSFQIVVLWPGSQAKTKSYSPRCISLAYPSQASG